MIPTRTRRRPAAGPMFIFLISTTIPAMAACGTETPIEPGPPAETIGDSTALEIAPRDRYVTVNDVRLHYREWGSEDAPPVLILHGLTGHSWEFDSVAAALATDYRVLVLDQRGHGASEWASEYSPAVMADDIAGFIRVLKLRRVRVVGHSMGGVNAWWFVARHPARVRQLVSIDVTPEVVTTRAFTDLFIGALEAYAQARYATPEEAVVEYLTGYTGDQTYALQQFVLNNIEQGADGFWRWRFDGNGLTQWMESAYERSEGHWRSLRRIRRPTLVIRAGNSPFTVAEDAEAMTEAIERATLVEIPNSGHDVHIDQREALVEQLRQFFQSR